MWSTIGEAATAGWGPALRVAFMLTVPGIVVSGTVALVGETAVSVALRSLLRLIP
jgi:hypothetical protein